MNRLIGITGGMSSGKTTIAKEIIKNNPDFVYVDVDEFRRDLFSNIEYQLELKKSILELNNYSNIDSNILNAYIYSNEDYMKKYKEVLYKYLFRYLQKFNNKTIVVDWALILNDDIYDKFEKIIYVEASEEVRLSRLKNSDLSREEILKRFRLQRISNLEQFSSDELLIINNNVNFDIDKINSFINSMECKFTLPNGEAKAIWEITHQCNYNCSYCIFSCNKKKIEGELNTTECFHVIDELVSNNFKHLKITGGEPFIRKDIIDILRYASDKLITDVSTNASLINEEKVKLLNEIKLKMIHVSLDGDKFQHESVRGKNTYERTLRGLEALKNSVNIVRIGAVIHKNNEMSLENLIVDSATVGADEIIFSIMEPVLGQDKSLIKTISNDELISKLQELKSKYNKDIIVNHNFGHQPNYIHECPGGDKFIYINNFGQVSPCTWVLENDKSCISTKSLRNNTLESLIREESLQKFVKSKCKGKCYGKI